MGVAHRDRGFRAPGRRPATALVDEFVRFGGGPGIVIARRRSSSALPCLDLGRDPHHPSAAAIADHTSPQGMACSTMSCGPRAGARAAPGRGILSATTKASTNGIVELYQAPSPVSRSATWLIWAVEPRRRWSGDRRDAPAKPGLIGNEHSAIYEDSFAASRWPRGGPASSIRA